MEDLDKGLVRTIPASSAHFTLISTMTGHRSTIFCVTFSKDGKKAITASTDGFWKLWYVDIELGYTHQSVRLENTYKLASEIYEPLNTKGRIASSFHFISDMSSDGANVLFSNGGSIYIYSVITGKLIKKIQLPDLALEVKWGRGLVKGNGVGIDEIVVALQRNKALQVFDVK
jgi:WD40 repeat protein